MLYYKENLPEVFKNAVMLCELTTDGAKFRSIYMDPNGELSINFDGHLSNEQVKTVIMHFKDIIDGDTNVDKITTEPFVDFVRWDSKNDKYTQIFTPDGYNYKRFVV